MYISFERFEVGLISNTFIMPVLCRYLRYNIAIEL